MSPSTPQYADTTPIHLGDRVAYNDQLGAVVFVIETGEYSREFPEEHWGYLQRGFMIRFDNGALLHLEESDDHLRRITQ